MAWKMRGSPKIVRVTHALALKWANMEAAHVNRPLSNRRIKSHNRTLSRRQFRSVDWACAYCKQTKTWIRVNGAHTSTLFASVNLAECQPLIAKIERYHCDTLEDVAELYATFDSRTQTRSTGDVNRAYAATVPELADLDIRTVSLIIGGMAYHLWTDHNASKVSVDERAALIVHNVEFATWYSEIAPFIPDAAHLRRAPVVAAMFATYKKDPDDATKFWEAVRDDTGETPECPDRRLCKFLSIYRVNVSGQSPKRFRLSPKEFYVRCLKAWNMWRKGVKAELTYRHADPVPDVI